MLFPTDWCPKYIFFDLNTYSRSAFRAFVEATKSLFKESAIATPENIKIMLVKYRLFLITSALP
jgi:hypothetical protein